MTPKTIEGKAFICIFIIISMVYFGATLPEIFRLSSHSAVKIPLLPRYKKYSGEKHIILCGTLNYYNIRDFFQDFYGHDPEYSSKGILIV